MIKKSIIHIKNLFSIPIWDKVDKADVIIFCHDNDRSYEFNKKAYSPLVDTVNESLKSQGLKTLSIACPFSVLVNRKAFNDPISLNWSFSLAFVLRRLLLFLKFNIETCNYLVYAVWSRILRKSGAKVVIGIQPSKELCFAAKNLGVWTIDIQHGVIGEENYYGKKYRNDNDEGKWPDVLACWNDENVINARKICGSKISDIINIGNPWILRFLRKAADDLVLMDAFLKLPQLDARPVVLVSLQWGITNLGKANKIDIGLRDSIVEVVNNNSDLINWWIRVHPVTYRSNKSKEINRIMTENFGIEGEKAFWNTPTEMALPIVLSGSKFHITYNSATTIEAAMFGVKTALLDNNSSGAMEYFKDQIDHGMAEIIADEPQSILNWLENIRYTNKNSPDIISMSKNYDEFIMEVLNRCKYFSS